MNDAELQRLKDAYWELNESVCQSLGQALGYYPWYKNDQENFPGATEAQGVCVGEHTAESIADEAAARIKELTKALEDVETDVKCMLIEDSESRAMQNHALAVIKKVLKGVTKP